MRQFNRPQVAVRSYLLWIALLAFVMTLPQLAAAHARQPTALRNSAAAQKAARRASSPQDILALGLYYFNNDDISGLVEQQFRLLTDRYAGTDEAESAQYFLASYYERKFYIQRAKWRRDDWGSLKQAIVEYRRYTDKYYSSGTSKWLADAFFNLAIVYMQLNDNRSAVNELSKIGSAAARDSTIYVYQIIWSQQSKDVIDANLLAVRLRDITLSLTAKSDSYFEQRLVALTQWCQGQKSKKAHSPRTTN